MNSLRVAALRRLYRVAWLALQLRAAVIPRRARGVKCVLTHRGQVLLVRHTYGKRSTWYIPGGGVRRRESPLHAAQREMHEELGLDGLRWRELTTREMRLDRISVRLTCLHAELPDPTRLRVDPVEIAQVGWFAAHALPAPRGEEVTPLLDLLSAADAR